MSKTLTLRILLAGMSLVALMIMSAIAVQMPSTYAQTYCRSDIPPYTCPTPPPDPTPTLPPPPSPTPTGQSDMTIAVMLDRTTILQNVDFKVYLHLTNLGNATAQNVRAFVPSVSAPLYAISSTRTKGTAGSDGWWNVGTMAPGETATWTQTYRLSNGSLSASGATLFSMVSTSTSERDTSNNDDRLVIRDASTVQEIADGNTKGLPQCAHVINRNYSLDLPIEVTEFRLFALPPGFYPSIKIVGNANVAWDALCYDAANKLLSAPQHGFRVSVNPRPGWQVLGNTSSTYCSPEYSPQSSRRCSTRFEMQAVSPFSLNVVATFRMAGSYGSNPQSIAGIGGEMTWKPSTRSQPYEIGMGVGANRCYWVPNRATQLC